MNTNKDENKKIFANFFTLNIINEKIQENYEEKIRGKTYLFLIYLLFITVLLVCGLSLVSELKTEIRENESPDSIKYYGYLCCSFLTVTYILYFIQLKYFKVAQAFLYFNLVSVIMISLFFLSYLKMLITIKIFQDYDIFI